MGGKKKIPVSTGDRYGRLTVVSEVAKTTKGREFIVDCDCGNTTQVWLNNLRSGHTSSCGCLSREAVSSRNATHRMTGTREFSCWQNMLERCTSPTHRYFEQYSKLGIQENWKHDFMAFLNHIGMQPNSEHKWSIGRIDNDVGYFEGNVRWETGYEQNRNRGKTKANTSGHTGVTWREGTDRPFGRAIATWYELSGKQRSKSFSEEFIGKEAAILAASEYRSQQIQKLNEEGAGYAEKHGK